MKIKTKKTMILPQLIEWAWDNEVKDRIFLSDSYCVGFDRHGYIYFNSQKTISPNQTFTVEVEEELTEDAEFNELVGLDVDGDYWQYDNVCVYDFNLDRIKAIYTPNDDLTMTLIWTKEKGLVE